MEYSVDHLDSVLGRWLPHGSWTISRGLSGMNNSTYYIEAGGARYVLRVYETHRDESKVHYEHAVLLGLAKLVPALPFSTPTPKVTAGGETFLRLEAESGKEAGKLAALFHYLPGERPTMDSDGQLHHIGAAVAQLSSALKLLKLALEPEYPAYYLLGLAESSELLQEMIRFCEEPGVEAFQEWSVELRRLGELLGSFASQAVMLQELPHQLIHGDLNVSNMLVDSQQRIAALLDFEFTTMDLRVMELAVCLADIIVVEPAAELSAMEQITSIAAEAAAKLTAMEQIAAFLAGYGSSAKLTPDEVVALPLLIQLRRLDVFIHFASRYKAGIDPAEVVIEMIRTAVHLDKWLETERDSLVELCEKYLLE